MSDQTPAPKEPLPKTATLIEKPNASVSRTASATTNRTASRTASRTQQQRSSLTQIQVKRMGNIAHAVVALWTGIAAFVSTSDSQVSQFLERQAQTTFFELRGPVPPSPKIVIVAMDNATLQAARNYVQAPKALAYLQPITTNPWQRSAYAVAINRLMEAGAKSVSLDVVLDAASEDPKQDERLVQTLTKFTGRVVLASSYEQTEQANSAATLEHTALLSPYPSFADRAVVGNVSHLVEANGKIHRLGKEYLYRLAEAQSQEALTDQQVAGLEELRNFAEMSPQAQLTFAEATLKAAGVSYPPPRGNHIYFYGPDQTFDHVSFQALLEPAAWQQMKHRFRDAIVLIGPTATIFQDLQAAPFSKTLRYPIPMAGIEVNANEIATLLEGKTLMVAMPHPWIRGIAVFLVVGVAVSAQIWLKRSLFRLLVAWGSSLALLGLGYVLFTVGGLIIPVAIPSLAIALSGLTYFIIGGVNELLNRRNLRRSLEPYTNVPLIRAIISQQEDLKDLLRDREMAVVGKLLGGRYRIVELLGAGGFGETYVAQDVQLPNEPKCVVKQLRPSSSDLRVLQYSRQLFEREAQTLQRLGSHPQIPQLLAYFEEDNEFYLVQEYVEGHPLNRELSVGRHLPENQVVLILQDLLQILEFVHRQGVIHRDIKPSNILRRRTDGRLVLIDFGAVKEIQQSPVSSEEQSVTVGVGTQGYMPSEQCAGSPRLNSDIYAVGKMAIQALVGLPPSQFKEDPRTGEILWQHQAQVSQSLAMVLSKMVRYDFRRRYQSAAEVLMALQGLATAYLPSSNPDSFSLVVPELDLSDFPEEETTAAITQPWPESFSPGPLNPSSLASDPLTSSPLNATLAEELVTLAEPTVAEPTLAEPTLAEPIFVESVDRAILADVATAIATAVAAAEPTAGEATAFEPVTCEEIALEPAIAPRGSTEPSQP